MIYKQRYIISCSMQNAAILNYFHVSPANLVNFFSARRLCIALYSIMWSWMSARVSHTILCLGVDALIG